MASRLQPGTPTDSFPVNAYLPFLDSASKAEDQSMELESYLEAHVGGELRSVLPPIANASLRVREMLPFAQGIQGRTNPSGEEQTEIDVYSNKIFVSALLKTHSVAEVASEEMEKPMNGDGVLHVSMDPLDGSSNISTNNPLGSIFGFYSAPLPCSGESMIGAAFVTYGPMLTITFATGGRVSRFVHDGKNFVILDESIKLPMNAEVFGFGGLRRDWIEPVEKFVRSLEKRGVKLRYGGTFVGDYNQVLKYGGIFAYPSLKSKPRGKLRLLYEVAPMAFVTKHAGGLASDGVNDVLSLKPSEFTETCPAYLGSETLVRELEGLISKARYPAS